MTKCIILASLFLLSVFHGKSRQGLLLFKKEFGLIIALWFLFSLFILSAGMAPEGNAEVLTTLRSRFSHNLPEDNALQYIFAMDIVRGNIPHPMLWDWLSSDRPPLGTAYALLFSSTSPNEFDYQIESTLLQCLWLCGLWVFLRAYKTNSLAIAIVLLATMFSGLAIVNGIYVWPKLLPVFYLLLLSALLFSSDIKKLGRLEGIVIGCLAALAMLCHGGSIFALLGIALTLLIRRSFPKLEIIGIILLTALSVYAPWMVYQSVIDPPGNRLLKWHMAGVVAVDARSFSQAMHDYYGSLTLSGYINNKLLGFANLITDTTNSLPSLLLVCLGRLDITELKFLRESQFFYIGSNLAFSIFALPALLIRRKEGMAETAALIKTCFIVACCTTVLWILLIYDNTELIIHQGTLFLPIIINVALVLLAYSRSPYFAAILTLANLLCAYWLYFSFGWSMSGKAPIYGDICLAIISFLLIFSALFCLSRKRYSTSAVR
jgi:hypothetical protein